MKLLNFYSHWLRRESKNPPQVSDSGSRNEHVDALIGIGTALMAERNLDSLLVRILEKSCQILIADAGSLFLAEGPSRENPTHLRFKLARNDSIPISLKEFLLPINPESIVGYVAQTRQAIRISDVYRIPKSLPFRFNPDIDRSTGYRSMSVLAVPMTDHQDELIGVVQLWNKKKNAAVQLRPNNVLQQVIPFTESCHSLLASLSAQAAVAIENARLHQDITRLFEGFIHASVTAIEARDPTTSGHSERVATLTTTLAEEVDRLQTGPYSDIRFSDQDLRELKYAALLHDFGKIGVRESVLIKAKKLFPPELEGLRDRLHLLHRTIEFEVERQIVHHLITGGQVGDPTWIAYEADLKRRLADLQKAYDLVVSSNEPTVLPESVSGELARLAAVIVARPDGTTDPLVSAEQIMRLSIPKGSLSAEERLEIESHVTHTYRFLNQIPWTKEFRRIPDIAYAHHEKLNGTGYPRRIRTADIPFPSKIMTVADIFDALAARDRPYKKAVPVQKALDILQMEVKEGKLDEDLVRLFVDRKVYAKTATV
ncbi:MAG TPA: HD domain-containing phosphohydrolase [Bdellovibrionota bacterium]|nr:HD domain-containing phosphohydrolase [Bdellovibrionota bacterium]